MLPKSLPDQGYEYGGCGRINERERRCSEGGERGLPHAAFVQKWRADEPQAVVCYHGNGGEGYRDGINKEPHQHHGRLIIHGPCFSTVILWWTINVAEQPFKESHRAGADQTNSSYSHSSAKTNSPYFCPRGSGLQIVKLSFQQSSSLLFLFLFFVEASGCLGYHKTLSTHPRGLESMLQGPRMFVCRQKHKDLLGRVGTFVPAWKRSVYTELSDESIM